MEKLSRREFMVLPVAGLAGFFGKEDLQDFQIGENKEQIERNRDRLSRTVESGNHNFGEVIKGLTDLNSRLERVETVIKPEQIPPLEEPLRQT